MDVIAGAYVAWMPLAERLRARKRCSPAAVGREAAAQHSGGTNQNAHRVGGRSRFWGPASRRPKCRQIAPRPVRERPVAAFTTTTTMIAPITDTTMELRS